MIAAGSRFVRRVPSGALVAVAALATALLLLSALPAAGHAVRVETEPADGQVLHEPPTEVALGFNEPIDLPAIIVMGALYMWAWRDAARHSSATIAELASWFTPVLVPVVVAFAVSLAAGPVLTELARLARLLADPFGAGTVGIVRPPPVRVVIGAQAVALLAGHVAAMLILRDRAASYRGDLVRTLTAPVAVLAAYLAAGTLTLFGG